MGTILSWAIRALAGAFAYASGAEIWKWFHDAVSSLWGLLALLGINSAPTLVGDAAEKLNKMTVALNPVAMKLAADTLTQITGVGTSPAWVGFLAEQKPSRTSVVDIGDSFFPVVTNMFDVLASGADAGSRAPGSAWRNNLNAFFGTNLLFQMRSLTISTIARMTGLESLRHLEGLHQTINWAFGFGWLSWAVMSNYMDVTINDDMKKALNAQILGKDMTLSQAIDASIRGYLTANDSKELLDNYGLKLSDRDAVKRMSMRLLTVVEALDAHLMGQLSRSDLDAALKEQAHDASRTDLMLYARQNGLSPTQAAHAYWAGLVDDKQYHELINRALLTPQADETIRTLSEKLLSDSDIKTLWQEQQIDDATLSRMVRLKGYGADRAAKEVALLKDERRLKLRDEWLATERQLFRDCVIDEAELRADLAGEHYTQSEQDWVVKVELARRRIRTFLPTTDMVKAIKAGLIDVNDAMNQLQCRGWTYDDAIVELLLKLQDKLPPCDDVKLEEKAMIGLLQAFGSNIGISGKLLRPNVLKYLQCLSFDKFLLPPVVNISASTTRLPGAGNVTLSWKAILATSAKIEPILGPVPLEGETSVHIAHSQGFTIHGHSPIGDSTAYVFIDVAPKS